ncbi:unnamed protein product [Soboliphyme baturini]|uniref:Pecanex-like protein n=1 Tax=Soboliphyme baturini TaxID=241478 RepID=A0A183IML2_9BILA|nr:unnamed protein product [Soboliphyme baturini]
MQFLTWIRCYSVEVDLCTGDRCVVKVAEDTQSQESSFIEVYVEHTATVTQWVHNPEEAEQDATVLTAGGEMWCDRLFANYDHGGKQVGLCRATYYMIVLATADFTCAY